MELITVGMCTGGFKYWPKKEREREEHLNRHISPYLDTKYKASRANWTGKRQQNDLTRDHLALSCACFNARCLLCTKPVWKSSTLSPHSPVRSGGRILILVRQPDPRFTPRVWLVPIVHCQGLLMERQQWILSPYKWLSDRAPSSITSYNVEVQKMRPSGGLIWCFICSFEKLLSFFFLPLLPAK